MKHLKLFESAKFTDDEIRDDIKNFLYNYGIYWNNQASQYEENELTKLINIIINHGDWFGAHGKFPFRGLTLYNDLQDGYKRVLMNMFVENVEEYPESYLKFYERIPDWVKNDPRLDYMKRARKTNLMGLKK